MKWNSRAKLTATATSALLFTLLLASCSNNNNNNTNVQLPVTSPVQQEQTQEEQTDNDTEQSNDTDDSSSVVEPTPAVTKEPVLQDSTIYEATGMYVGAIDSRSIEVTVNGQPTVFLLDDEFDYVISDFNESEKVTIKYNKQKTDDGNYIQNIVTEISVAK